MSKENYEQAESLRQQYEDIIVSISEYREAAGKRMFDQENKDKPLIFERDGVVFKVDPFSPIQQGKSLIVETQTKDSFTRVRIWSNPSVNGKDEPKGAIIFENQNGTPKDALIHIQKHIETIQSLTTRTIQPTPEPAHPYLGEF